MAEPQPATTLNMDPSAFVDDLHNSVHFHCADSFDVLDSTVRKERGVLLTPEQQAAYQHGSSLLYMQLKEEVDAQLQKFEQYALETCLHVPAGLLVQPSSTGEGEVAVDEAEEAAVDEQLRELRRQIAAAKHQGRKLKATIQQYDAALEQYSSSLASLQAVPGVLAGKENTVEQDSRVLAAAAMQLEESCRQLDGLKQQKAAAGADNRPGSATGAAAAQKDDMAAEKEILRRQTALLSMPADSLRRLQNRLAS